MGAELLADESSEEQRRASRQGGLWAARENEEPGEAGEEAEGEDDMVPQTTLPFLLRGSTSGGL